MIARLSLGQTRLSYPDVSASQDSTKAIAFRRFSVLFISVTLQFFCMPPHLAAPAHREGRAVSRLGRFDQSGLSMMWGNAILSALISEAPPSA